MDTKTRNKILIILSIVFLCTSIALVAYVGINNINFKNNSNNGDDTNVTDTSKENEKEPVEESEPKEEVLSATELAEFEKMFNNAATIRFLTYANYNSIKAIDFDDENMMKYVYSKFDYLTKATQEELTLKGYTADYVGLTFYTIDIIDFIASFETLSGRTLTSEEIKNSKLWDSTLNKIKIDETTDGGTETLTISESKKIENKYTFSITVTSTKEGTLNKAIDITKTTYGTYVLDSVKSI